jgi:uncharacterized protein with NRDE domain
MVVVAANRDEDPSRPADPPGVLVDRPRVVGGRDRVAGGTWLAIRERRAAVALLNRRPLAGAPPPEKSRGLLALEVARVAVDSGSLAARALEEARRLASGHRFAPFSLVFASPERCWILSNETEGTKVIEVEAGWHVITHSFLDDPDEPRTARLLRALAGWAPRSLDEMEREPHRLLSLPAGDPTRGDPGPAVCIHDGRMVTVSSSIVVLGANLARYLHAEGRPCEHALLDHSQELKDEPSEIS